jgi:hypothetical protein
MMRWLIVGALLAAPQAAEARRKAPVNSVSFGVGTFPIQISGLTDVHLSDGDTFPAAEGRLNLELGRHNTDGPGLLPAGKFGFTLGRGMILGAFDLYAGAANGVTGAAALIGVDIRVKQRNFTIGVPLRIGAITAGADLGTATLLPGATGPVILEQGTINEGDALNASINGVMASAGVLGELWITKQLAIRGEASIQQGAFSGFTIRAGTDDPDTTEEDERVAIDGDDIAIKKTDGSLDQADMNPAGGTFGVSGFVGVTLKF